LKRINGTEKNVESFIYKMSPNYADKRYIYYTYIIQHLIVYHLNCKP